MSRKTRGQVFDPSEVATVHVMNRVVRRCFLMGNDSLTGKNYDHRKEWMESELERVAACFGIDCLNFAILCNHFHLMLRSRPDVVQGWNNQEVARRWLLLCPKGKRRPGGSVRAPTQRQIRTLCSDKHKLKQLRSRLSDISWWMRLVCQRIAQWANREDKEVGKFWQSRFHAVRLLDEAAILAGAAYIDLNPLRAAIADCLELSEHTSLQRRLQRLREDMAMHCDPELKAYEIDPEEPSRCDSFLAPLEIDQRAGQLGPLPSRSGKRASDKGYLDMTLLTYYEFAKWTERELALRRSGAAPPPGSSSSPPPEVLKRLGLSTDAWCGLVSSFRKLFSAVAGKPENIDAYRNPRHRGPYYLPKGTRELLQPTEEAAQAAAESQKAADLPST